MMSAQDRLVVEGESLDGHLLVAAHGSRVWKVRELVSPHPRRYGYPRDDVVYDLYPQGGDGERGAGGVKRIVRSEHELIVWGWRVIQWR